MRTARESVTRVLQIMLLSLLLLCLAACATAGGGQRDIEIVEFKEWNIHSELQQKYFDDPDYKNVNAYAVGEQELSYPESPEFQWSYTGTLSASTLTDLYLVISENKDLSDPMVRTPRLVATSYAERKGALNLKVNTTYYWQIQAYDNQGVLHTSKVSSFKTLEGPRNIGVDGVANFRDLGGYTTTTGMTVNQGLLYRCGKLNENYTRTCTVKEAGLEALKELGIKTEIDFRGNTSSDSGTKMYINGYAYGTDESKMKSVVPSITNYIHCPLIYDDAILGLVDGKNMYRKAFEALADESNYPILFHCSIGTDRTGAFAILVERFLGLEEEDIIRDYLFSNFGGIGSKRAYAKYQLIVAVLGRYPGETNAEKAANYLLSIGVTQETMDKVKAILLSK